MHPKSIPKNGFYIKTLLNILLDGSEDFNCNANKEILKATIEFLKISERFHGPIIWPFLKNVCSNDTYFLYVYIYMQSWKQCALPTIITVTLWQLMHLGTWWTVTHCCYQWTKECSTSWARSIIQVVISDPRHTECSNFTEAQFICKFVFTIAYKLRSSCFCEIWALCMS